MELDNLVKEIAKLKFVSAIFLFGSQVNGRARKDSDIDVCVLTKNASRKQELQAQGFSNDKIDISIFSRLPLVIQFRVLKEGKLIFCKDEMYLHDTKYETFRRYLDYSYFIKNFYRRVIKNV